MAEDDHAHDLTDPAPPPSAAGEGAAMPERRCILSAAHGPRAELVRLALGPEGQVAPDIRARAGGRGAWIGVDRATLATAVAKGRLRGALQRAFRLPNVTVPADLPEQIERALRRAVLDRLGLEARAGQLLTGTEKIAEQLRRGAVSLLIHAEDAAVDGTRKLDQALRVGLDRQGEDLRGLVIPVDRAILSLALGRENVVHLALIAPAAGARVEAAIRRWRDYIGRDDSGRDVGAGPCDMPSQGPSAHRDARVSNTV